MKQGIKKGTRGEELSTESEEAVGVGYTDVGNAGELSVMGGGEKGGVDRHGIILVWFLVAGIGRMEHSTRCTAYGGGTWRL